MRQYKFRGQHRGGGGWVYGDLHQWPGGDCEIVTTTDTGRVNNFGGAVCEVKRTEVKPETVGQFTGMTDKNEVEIYEGDILNVHNFYFDGGGEAEAETNGILSWGELGWHLLSVTGWIAEYMGYEKGSTEASAKLSDIIPAKYMDAEDSDGLLLHEKWGLHEESYTVIGNVHGNPERINPAPATT